MFESGLVQQANQRKLNCRLHRLRTIYNTNIRTATAHGQYRQQVENNFNE